MNRCHTCTHWRRLKHHQEFGLCRNFTGFRINQLPHDAALAGVTDKCGENYGLPNNGLITGWAFGCLQHTSNKQEPLPTITKLQDL